MRMQTDSSNQASSTVILAQSKKEQRIPRFNSENGIKIIQNIQREYSVDMPCMKFRKLSGRIMLAFVVKGIRIKKSGVMLSAEGW